MSAQNKINILKKTVNQNTIQSDLSFGIKGNHFAQKAHLMKLVAYLRIYASIMQESQQQQTNDRQRKHRSHNYFMSLLKSLFEQDPEWWQKCEITLNGRIQSDDPTINQILQPLEKFYHRLY
ncbi:hypothetical protein NIES2100_69450 [Calothrix sp. NIES-2100]|nr:hypothetical protein NIES2100_69450 [Calothrix sp. NIES-2100]